MPCFSTVHLSKNIKSYVLFPSALVIRHFVLVFYNKSEFVVINMQVVKEYFMHSIADNKTPLHFLIKNRQRQLYQITRSKYLCIGVMDLFCCVTDMPLM